MTTISQMRSWHTGTPSHLTHAVLHNTARVSLLKEQHTQAVHSQLIGTMAHLPDTASASTSTNAHYTPSGHCHYSTLIAHTQFTNRLTQFTNILHSGYKQVTLRLQTGWHAVLRLGLEESFNELMGRLPRLHADRVAKEALAHAAQVAILHAAHEAECNIVKKMNANIQK